MIASTPLDSRLGLTEHELAAQIGMSVFFLQKDRCTKRLLPFYRIGSAIRYNRQRVAEALAAMEEGGQPRTKKQGA
jgi:hypothetical protein